MYVVLLVRRWASDQCAGMVRADAGTVIVTLRMHSCVLPTDEGPIHIGPDLSRMLQRLGLDVELFRQRSRGWRYNPFTLLVQKSAAEAATRRYGQQPDGLMPKKSEQELPPADMAVRHCIDAACCCLNKHVLLLSFSCSLAC